MGLACTRRKEGPHGRFPGQPRLGLGPRPAWRAFGPPGGPLPTKLHLLQWVNFEECPAVDLREWPGSVRSMPGFLLAVTGDWPGEGCEGVPQMAPCEGAVRQVVRDRARLHDRRNDVTMQPG